MDKRSKVRITASSVTLDETRKSLVWDSLQVDPNTEDFVLLLQRLEQLAPHERTTFALSVASEGQERAFPVLGALASSPEWAAPAVEALGTIKSQEAALKLQELAHGAPSRDARKAASRGLYRLRSLGFRAEMAAPATATSIAVPSSRFKRRAWASSVDGEGTRFLFLTIPEPLGGHRNLVFLMINDTHGISEARVGHAEDDQEVLARVEAVARESELPHIEIPEDYARHLVKEGRERTQAAGRPLPTEYMVWKEVIGEPEETWNRHPVYQELNAAQIMMEPVSLEQSARLLDLREFWSWRLDTEQMRPYARELEQAKGGSIVLPEAAQSEREERVLEKALADLLQDEGRARYKRRLEEMSYLLLHTGREREAKASLAAALAMDQEGRHSSLYLPGSRASDFTLGERSPFAHHPFFRRLLVESLNMALERLSRGRKLIVAG